MGKILLVVSIVLTGLTAALGFLNKSKLDETKKSVEDTTASLNSTKAELTKTKGSLADTSKNLETTTAAKEQAVAQVATLTSEVSTAKSQATELGTQISAKENEITSLKADLAAKTAELEAKAAATVTPESAPPSAEVLAQIEEQKTLITKLQSDLDGARSQLNDLRIQNKNRMEKKLQAGLEGRILAVNQAWNFVVLNLGDRNGIVNNAELLVKRGNRLVGKVRITSVEPSISIADIVANSVAQGVNIAPGDNVIYQASEE